MPDDFEKDVILNQYPVLIRNLSLRQQANSWLSSKTNLFPIGELPPERYVTMLQESSTAEAPSLTSKAPSKLAGTMQGAAIGAAVSAGGSMVGGIFGLGGSIIQANAQRDIAAMQTKLGYSQLAQQQSMFDTEWAAARAAGLYSPAQFGSIQGAGYYKAGSYGPGLSARVRAPTGSPYQ